MKMTLTSRDKKLLLVLAIVTVLCLPYFFVIQPLMDKNATIISEIAELQNQKSYLTDLRLNETTYQQQTEELATETQNLLDLFPSELPQEASILFIDNTEKKIPIKLHQVTFGEDVASQITSDAEEEQIDAVEAETGDVTDDEVIQEVTETTAISDGLSGMYTETQFSFEAGYKEYKDFLNYIQTYPDRMVIYNMTATYTMNTVNGNFTMRQYAITGDGRLPVNILEPNLMHGTTNVFMQAAGVGSDASEEAASDFFLMLSQPDAEVESFIVGRAADPSEETYLTSDENTRQEVTIEFEGEGGEYRAYYKIGKKSFSDEGVVFAPNGMINFEIISSPRVGDKDKVAAKVNIVNNTDLTVNVKVTDEDEENPRVSIMGKTGVIQIEE